MRRRISPYTCQRVRQQFSIRQQRFFSRSRLALGQYAEFAVESTVVVDGEYQIAFSWIDDCELVAFNLIVQYFGLVAYQDRGLSPLIVMVIGLPGPP